MFDLQSLGIEYGTIVMLGMLLVLTGLCISQNDGWVILKYLLTALFLWLTSPTGSHLIARLELTTNEHPEQEMEMIDL